MAIRSAGLSDKVTLYTTKEAAELLKLHPQTLVTWRTSIGGGAPLPFVKIGRTVRYRHTDILKFIESNSFTNAA